MQTRSCVLHAQEDVRLETLEIDEMGPLPMEKIAAAFAIARDRPTQMKVQLSFAD